MIFLNTYSGSNESSLSLNKQLSFRKVIPYSPFPFSSYFSIDSASEENKELWQSSEILSSVNCIYESLRANFFEVGISTYSCVGFWRFWAFLGHVFFVNFFTTFMFVKVDVLWDTVVLALNFSTPIAYWLFDNLIEASGTLWNEFYFWLISNLHDIDWSNISWPMLF